MADDRKKKSSPPKQPVEIVDVTKERAGTGVQLIGAAKPRAGRPSSLVDTRVIYCGDCVDQLKAMPEKCVDLIYIDPPFNSNRNYEVFWGETKKSGPSRTATNPPRPTSTSCARAACELARVLKQTGSFYYHCDWHASHYVKVMLDQIFGENNFQCEIIWQRTLSKGLAFTGISEQSRRDSLLWRRWQSCTFNRPYDPYDPDNLDEKTATKYCHRDPDGRVYRLDNLINPNPNRPNLTYEFLGVKRVWRWTKRTDERSLRKRHRGADQARALFRN